MARLIERAKAHEIFAAQSERNQDSQPVILREIEMRPEKTNRRRVCLVPRGEHPNIGLGVDPISARVILFVATPFAAARNTEWVTPQCPAPDIDRIKWRSPAARPLPLDALRLAESRASRGGLR